MATLEGVAGDIHDCTQMRRCEKLLWTLHVEMELNAVPLIVQLYNQIGQLGHNQMMGRRRQAGFWAGSCFDI